MTTDKICECATCTEERDAAAAKRGALYAFAVGLGLFLAALALTFIGCGPVPAPKPPGPPPAVPIAFFEKSCRDIWLQELNRPIDEPDALKACTGAFLSGQTGEQVRAGVQASAEWKVVHAPKPPTPVVHADGRIFRTATGQPWRYKGVSAFALLNRFEKGEDIGPFLRAYKGYNVLRVWPYTDWPGVGWDVRPSAAIVRAFLKRVGDEGWIVELTLLTTDNPERLQWAKNLLAELSIPPKPTNLFVEAGNEPLTHKAIKTGDLKELLELSGFPHASGDYEDASRAYGSYLVVHTKRTTDWPRRAHDCLEWWSKGGSERPGPPQHKPILLDEPLKPGDKAYTDADAEAYFGGAGMMCGGATFHCETCKYAKVPTAAEAKAAAAALRGLDAFPADAPLAAASYRRIVETGQPHDGRTYVIGRFMVRSQQRGTTAPEAGWIPIGSSGVLWRRP